MTAEELERKKAVLAIVVPCYNEQEVLPETIKQLSLLLDEMRECQLIDEGSGVWLVDDGSSDNTWPMITEATISNTYINGIKLTRNKGHQNALLAGLETAEGDVLISVDADLQDDITVMKEMLVQYHAGYEVVYGVRKARPLDSPFKRITAEGYYRVIQKLGVEVVFNHADFRLMSGRAIQALKQHEEVNLFLRGMIPSIGFPSTSVEYDRAERFAGESKYPLKKMLALAADGVTSFSAVPLRFIALLGFLIFVFSVGFSTWVLWVRLFTEDAIPGWASSVLPMYLLGGIQLLSVGVLGEYVAKTYMETKKRPRYIIDETIR